MDSIIKLTEKQLYNIVKESVKSILQNKFNEDDFDVNSINISDIDINILKQAYIDLRLIPTITVYGDILSDLPNINESIGDAMPPDEVVSKILKKYHLNQNLISKREGYNNVFIYIITACIGVNDKIIEDDMKKMGYFIGCKGNIQTIDNMKFQVLQFEPKQITIVGKCTFKT